MPRAGRPQKAPGSCRCASTDAPIVVASSVIHHGRHSAVRREMRFAVSGDHASVTHTAASTASYVGCPGNVASQSRITEFAPRACRPASSARALGSASRCTKCSLPDRSTVARSNDVSCALTSPAAAKRSIISLAPRVAAAWRLGPTIAMAAASTALGALPASREACAATSSGVPASPSAARNRGGDELAIVVVARLVEQRELDDGLEGQGGRLQHRHAVEAADLGRRVHLRGARGVLHVLARQDGADLSVERRDLLVVR